MAMVKKSSIVRPAGPVIKKHKTGLAMENCGRCSGSGLCQDCQAGMGANGNPCGACRGSGSCPQCSGTGKV